MARNGVIIGVKGCVTPEGQGLFSVWRRGRYSVVSEWQLEISGDMWQECNTMTCLTAGARLPGWFCGGNLNLSFIVLDLCFWTAFIVGALWGVPRNKVNASQKNKYGSNFEADKKSEGRWQQSVPVIIFIIVTASLLKRCTQVFRSRFSSLWKSLIFRTSMGGDCEKTRRGGRC